MSNVEKLRRAYQLWHDTLGGSVADWMNLFDENVVMRSLASGAPGMEFTATRRGRAEAEHYYVGLRDDWEMIYFNTDEFISEGDRVAVLGRCAWRHRRTGKKVESPFAQFLKFRAGLIIELVEFYNTAAAIEAARTG